MSILEVAAPDSLTAAVLIVGFDGWVNAGSAATATAEHLAEDSELIGRADPDALFDYRATRPTADFENGRLVEVDYPQVILRHRRLGGRDLLILSGPEPNWRWQELSREVANLAVQLGVVEHISLGGIPWATPHTRPTSIIVTASGEGTVPDDPTRPAGLLRVPASVTTAIEFTVAGDGIPTRGFWARVPQYVGATYLPAAVALIERVSTQLGISIPFGNIVDEAAAQRTQMDEIVASRPEVAAIVEQLEALTGAEEPAGEELAAEIERFLQQRAPEDDPWPDGDR